MSSRKYQGDSPEEIASRLEAAVFNLRQATETATQLKRLHSAMANIGVSDTPRQLLLIKSALAYVSEIGDSAPRALNADLRIITNELQSLRDGIRANSVSQEEMFLTSSLQAANKATKLVLALTASVNTLKAGISAPVSAVPNTVDLGERVKLPDLTKKEFGVARVPLTFSLMPSSGHTQVGYLDPDMMSHLGFKVDLLDGYAIVHGQVVIAINRSMVEDTDPIQLEDGTISKSVTPKRVKERVTKFVNSKPTTVVKRRDKTMLDAANEVRVLLEKHTNVKYSFVSERSYNHKGDLYFWLMPSGDLTRFARAFPGGHIRIHAWGFAFR